MTRKLLTTFIVLSLLLSFAFPSEANAKRKSIEQRNNVQQLIVKTKDIHIERKLRVDRVLFNNGFKYQKLTNRNYAIPRDNRKSITRQIRDLKRTGLFEYVEADGLLEIDSKTYTGIIRRPNSSGGLDDNSLRTNDTHFNQQFHLDIIKATKAWNHSTGSAVTVAVLDSGVDATHPDLAGKVIGRPGHSEDLVDSYGHGTKVAGIIAATGNNGQGIAGVAYNTKILSIKVINDSGQAFASSIIEGLEDAYQNGAKIVQLSLSTTTDFQSVRDAISLAQSRGILIVSTAGNTGTNQVRYPAGYNGVIGVASINSSYQKESYSSTGSHVNLAAPGTNIYTTISGGYYGAVVGTSFASPQVSATAALILSINPKLTNNNIRTILYQSAADIGSPGIDSSFGHGVLDAHTAALYASN